jgi:hypothetical protein
MKLILQAIVAMTAATCCAQSIESTPAMEARAFDFWIGDWNIQQKILQKDGTWLELKARTSVSKTLNGSALIEHWEGQVQFFWEGMQKPELMKGLSVRAYDPQTRKWYIHWMDTRRPFFGTPYSGGFDQGRGEFFRTWQTPEGERMGRITFSNISSNSVDWELAISKDDGKSWSTLWTMHMERNRSQNAPDKKPRSHPN